MAEGRNQAAVSYEGSDSDKDILATVGRNNLRQSPIIHKGCQTAAAGRNLHQTAAAGCNLCQTTAAGRNLDD